MKQKMDLDTTDSKHGGFKGFFEHLLRKFKLLFHCLLLMPLYLVAALVLGTCMVPGVFLFKFFQDLTVQQSAFIQNFSLGFSLAAGYFLYGFSMVCLVPVTNFLFRAYLKEWRGPYYSVESIKWFIHNGLTYLVRFTFLEFVTPTPISNTFYQMMGMKIGRGVVINTTAISDPSLISIGEKTTLGGSVTIVGHYGQGGLLIVAPVRIGRNCTVGLKVSIMGGVQIGDNAKIMPHSVVMPKTVIPPGEVWGGVPAQRIQAAPALAIVKAS